MSVWNWEVGGVKIVFGRVSEGHTPDVLFYSDYERVEIEDDEKSVD